MVVKYPPLPKGVKISFVPKKTHIEVESTIEARTALGLAIQAGLAFASHWLNCYLASAGRFRADRRVGPNERIVAIEKGGWGEPRRATVEVLDEQAHKGG